jgi:hypothetical protein
MADPLSAHTPNAANERSAGEPNMGLPITGDDPNDNIDPDDSGPRLLIDLKESSLDEICALPAAGYNVQ